MDIECQLKREAEIATKESNTGRRLLTWREMVILGWSVNRAMVHRGCSSRVTAQGAMQDARRKLRKQGWVSVPGKPAKAPAGDPALAQEARDIAIRSNWRTFERAAELGSVVGGTWE